MCRGIDVVNYCVRGEVSTYDCVWGECFLAGDLCSLLNPGGKSHLSAHP